MEWRDEGVLLSMRLHGESAAIIEVFTAAHGRHLGVVRGGGSRRMAAVLQPGTQVQVAWQARLNEHLGTFNVEPLASRAAILADRLALAGLNAVAALLHLALPERDPHPALWRASVGLMDLLASGGDWPGEYLRWELGLLGEIGFGLDLSRCAVTGGTGDLCYVSPRTGRAVSRAGAGEWAVRLLPLPAALRLTGVIGRVDVVAGLALTGYFLARGLEPLLGDKPMPEARGRLIAALSRPAASSE